MKRDGVGTARKLRRAPTQAEKCFWNAVRNRQLGAKFRRQWPIGRFVVDFVCLEAKLIVEIDGGQHAESRGDAQRTAIFEQLGYRVVRFWNNEVLGSTAGVLERLRAVLAD